jgi:Transposase, Mutator family
MSTKAKTETVLTEGAGGVRSEPVGRAEQPAGAAPRIELPLELREQLSDELIDQLLAGARSEEEIVGPGGVLAQLTKRLVERALAAELTGHLGYEPRQEPPGGVGNIRHGSTPKTLQIEQGAVEIRTPRDRNGSFEPQLVRKGQRRFQGFDDKILALYSRGMSTRDIEAHLREIYGVDVGRDLISRVTDAVMEDVREWQQRPLDDVYPVVFLDALVLKVREGGSVQRKACYLALGVTVEGERDVLGMWFQETEGAQDLDAGPLRDQAARRPRHPALLRRRVEGLPGGDRGGLPADDRADVHRAPDQAQPQVRAAQGARAGRS